MSRLFVLLPALALLAACAAAPEQPLEDVPPAQAGTAPAPAPEPVPEPVERPFPDDSLYPLLVAEFALRRGDYDRALQNYLQQARELDDAGVSRHTTHLAQFLDDDAATLEAVQLWLAREPDALEANNTAANLLARQGQPLAAVPHMAVVARSGKQANFPTLLQNYTDLSPEQRSQLDSALADLAREFPDDPALRLTQAIASAESGDLDRAREKLDQLFAIEPGQHQALLLEARINVKQQIENPFAHIEAVLAEHPENNRLRLEYARLLSATDIKAARQQFEILSAQSPSDANLLLSLALINREAGDEVIARAYLKQVLATGERSDDAHFYLGMLEEDAGDPDAAIAHYSQVSDGRQFLAAAQRTGELLLKSGSNTEMRAWFSRRRQSFPERAEQLYGVEAELLRVAGDTRAAEQVFDEALAALPNSGSLLYARAMLRQQRNDIAGMEADLRKLISRDPDNATALNALGYTLADQTDRLDEARSLVARALDLQPEEPAILDSMGWVLFRQGDTEGALHYLSKAYERFPDPEVAAHLGEALWSSGDRDEAMRIWEAALLAEPRHPVLLETLQRLGVDREALALPLPPPAPAP